MSRNVIVEALTQVGRKQRRPQHPFNLKYRPWQIAPFLIAPVLPGETMKNLLLQARCVSDPVKNPLIGWHNEYYFFYVKLRDLEDRDKLTAMLVSNTPVANSVFLPGGTPFPELYSSGGGYSFVSACNEAIVQHYFRDEEETGLSDAYADDATLQFYANSARPLAKITTDNFMQSLLSDTDAPITEQEKFPGEVLAQAPNPPPGFSDAYAHWEAMRSMSLTAVDFEDWLKSFGVKVPKAEQTDPHVPELLRYVRDWSYPSNTINPADGAPTSALSWSIAERADKDRFFAEPGFVFGVTVARPKVYFGKQDSSLTNYMNDAYSWLPALLQDDPYTSLRKFADAAMAGPMGANLPEAYWVDLRDLFLYGEQFLDDGTEANRSIVALPALMPGTTPEIKINKRFPSEADADGLFKNGATGFKHLRVDGRVDLTILSRIEETTP